MSAEQAARWPPGSRTSTAPSGPWPWRGRTSHTERPGTARRREGPGPHRAGTRRGHPGLRTGRGHRTARAALDRALSGNDAATVLAIRLNPADIEVLAKEGQDLPPACRCSRTRRLAAATPRSNTSRAGSMRASAAPWHAPAQRFWATRPGKRIAGGPAMIADWRPKGADYAAALRAAAPQRVGVVTSVMGLGLEVSGLDCALGDLVTVGSNPGLDAEVVAALDSSVRCMPLGRLAGVAAAIPSGPRAAPSWSPPERGSSAASSTASAGPSTARDRCPADPACRSTTRRRMP